METPLIEVENLEKHYGVSGGRYAALRGKTVPQVRAVNGIR